VNAQTVIIQWIAIVIITNVLAVTTTTTAIANAHHVVLVATVENAHVIKSNELNNTIII